MSLILKFDNFIDKFLSEIKEDICKKITLDSKKYNDVVDLLLEYSDNYDIIVEYDLYYSQRPLTPGSPFKLEILNGDLKMTVENLELNIKGIGYNNIRQLINDIESSLSNELHIWIGSSKHLPQTTRWRALDKIITYSKEIKSRVDKLYPNIGITVDRYNSPSLGDNKDDLVIVIKM
jgi:hypothetical protein